MRLSIVSGTLEGHHFTVDRPVTIGRGTYNHVVVPDPAVSLVHCQIDFQKGVPYLKDLGSTNGTRLNGERVVSAVLQDGDKIVVGKTRMLVELARPEAKPRDPLPTVVEHAAPPTVAPQPAEPPAGAESKDLSGNIFGSVTYFLKRKIASGGMGEVYEAEQFGAEGFIKKVAIKTITPNFAEQDNFVAAFVGEAKLVANLVHQNIVQIHHLGRHANGYYIAMEYIEGLNLSEFMARHRHMERRVPVDLAGFIVSRVSRGLEYAHRKTDDRGNPLGLVHRDVSPKNIMVTFEGEVKLTDFGVAKALRFMEDDARCLIGSVDYMSPEQARCDRVDARSDLFSLGLVYYELLTGVRVFQSGEGVSEDALARVRAGHVPDPRPLRADLPEPVAAIVMRCCERDLAARYPGASELSNDLEQALYAAGPGPSAVTLARYMAELEMNYRDFLARRKAERLKTPGS